MKLFDFVALPTLIVALVGGVNVLTEVTKKVATVKKAEPVVLFWAELLTILAAFCAVWLEGGVTWQAYALAGVCGVLCGGVVAYAAMFGYDELYKRVMGVFGSLFDYMGKKDDVNGTDQS